MSGANAGDLPVFQGRVLVSPNVLPSSQPVTVPLTPSQDTIDAMKILAAVAAPPTSGGANKDTVNTIAAAAVSAGADLMVQSAQSFLADLAESDVSIQTIYQDYTDQKAGIAKVPADQINSAAIQAIINTGNLLKDAIARHKDMQRTFKDAITSRSTDLDVELARQKFVAGKLGNIQAYQYEVAARVRTYVQIAEDAGVKLAIAAIFGA